MQGYYYMVQSLYSGMNNNNYNNNKNNNKVQYAHCGMQGYYYMAQSLYSGLSLRARGREFSAATMSMTPSYYHRKQKKMRPQELTGC